MAKNAKKQVNQPKQIQLFVLWCNENSPFAVLGGIVLSFLFCAVVDYSFFSIIFKNVFFGVIAIFCAFFIFVVRGSLLFHSFNGFSRGKNGMGLLSAVMQVMAVIWVCYEAPKVAETLVQDSTLLAAALQTQRDAGINVIRAIAIAATLLEVLMIMSISGIHKEEDDEDIEDDEKPSERITFETKPSSNGHHKLELEGNHQAPN